jgi:hypothetical protein
MPKQHLRTETQRKSKGNLVKGKTKEISRGEIKEIGREEIKEIGKGCV